MSKPLSMSKPVRYAVVGLGYIAQVAVLPAFAHARRTSRLHALVSGDSEKLAELGDRYGVSVRGSYQQLEDCLQDVEAVYICTPNSEHEHLAVRAAYAGVHVLCEKPLAVTDAACQRMINACREAGVKLMTAYRLHFDPLTLEMLERVRQGEIGEPRYFSSSFSMCATPGGIRTRRETGGGTVYDLGVYCINAARMFFGSEPLEVSGFSVPGFRSVMPEVDEMTAATLYFEGDRLASFTTSFAAADVSDFRLVGTKGHIHAQPAYEYVDPIAFTMTVGDNVTKRRGRKHDQFAAELTYFSRCIREDREPEPSGLEGAWDVRIIDAIYESAIRHEPISLRQFEGDPSPQRDQAMTFPPVTKPDLVNVEEPHR